MGLRKYSKWERLGIYFGYPRCCIDAFCNEMILRHQKRAGNQSGFIPCKKHARMVLHKTVRLEQLIQNRLEFKPFKK
jgi:hypothetical protein